MTRPVAEAVIVFDLDDTLYPERNFAQSGFRAAGTLYRDATGRAGLAERCLALFETGLRGRVFDEALRELAPEDAGHWTPRLVAAYRAHSPAIALSPDAARWLARAPTRARFGLVTDGPPAAQHGKIRALGLDRAIGTIIVTDDWGEAFRKPHPRAFAAMEAASGAPPDSMVYVGDNPIKDFIAPRARGWRTIRIARPERLHDADPPSRDHEPDATIDTLDALPRALERFGLRVGERSVTA